MALITLFIIFKFRRNEYFPIAFYKLLLRNAEPSPCGFYQRILLVEGFLC